MKAICTDSDISGSAVGNPTAIGDAQVAIGTCQGTRGTEAAHGITVIVVTLKKAVASWAAAAGTVGAFSVAPGIVAGTINVAWSGYAFKDAIASISAVTTAVPALSCAKTVSLAIHMTWAGRTVEFTFRPRAAGTFAIGAFRPALGTAVITNGLAGGRHTDHVAIIPVKTKTKAVATTNITVITTACTDENHQH